jgi:hypothetical protein
MFNVYNSTGCDFSQIAVLTNCVKQQKRKKIYRLSAVKCHLMNTFFVGIPPHKWSTWRAVHCCNGDRKLTINSQLTFISGFNFGPGVLFHTLT